MRDEIRAKAELAIEDLVDWLCSGYSLSASSSWGKDSVAVSILLIEAVKRVKAMGRQIAPCYVMSANTLVENQALDDYTRQMVLTLKQYAQLMQLPITYIEATPLETETWHWSHIGKGKLLRWPGMTRDCTLDLKIRPMMRLKSAMKKKAQRVISLVGTRYAESGERKDLMLKRGDKPGVINTNADGDLYATPIADWEVEDVWGLIMYCDSSSPRALYQSYSPDFESTLMIYRDANGGECVAALGDEKLNSSACGSRFGCYCCVASEKDKSMRAMIAEEGRHVHLAPVARFRDWLYAIRWDLTKRRWLGKKTRADGAIAVEPGMFRLSARIEMLKYMLTIDADEMVWAKSNNAAPRFQLVTPAQLIAIDYRWSIDEESDVGFLALKLYNLIVNQGQRFYISDLDLVPAPEVEIPPIKWFYNAIFTDSAITSKEITRFRKARTMHTDAAGAAQLLQSGNLARFLGPSTPADSAEFYLCSGIISVGPTQLAYANKQLALQSRWLAFKKKYGVTNIHAYVQAETSEMRDIA